MVLPDCEQDSKNTFPEKQLKTNRAKRLRIASKLLGSFQISFFPSGTARKCHRAAALFFDIMQKTRNGYETFRTVLSR